MKKQRKNNGITLISLVITIIILLILAGITIGLVIGDNGILVQATRAKEETEKAQVNESLDLANMEALINEYTGNIDIPQVTDEKPGELEQENEDTFIINSIEDLIFFSYDVTNGNTYEGKTVKLGVNLDFKSDKSYVNPNSQEYEKYGYTGQIKQALISEIGFKSIGSQDGTNSFYGTFDGNNKSICSLYIKINKDEAIGAGLFSTSYGKIENVKLEKINIIAETVQRTAIGGIVGISHGDIYKSHVSGNINVVTTSWTPLGGICGEMLEKANIQDCYNLSNINCKNIMEGYGNSDIGCGGILGQGEAHINKCYNRGNITIDAGDNNTSSGGICGALKKGTLKNSYNNAKIEGNSTNVESTSANFGGICGSFGTSEKSSMINCYNAGEITAKGINYAIIGGISAYSRNNTEFKNIFNIGNIKGEGKEEKLCMGGILGMSEGIDIGNNYNIGVLKKLNSTGRVGGIIGVKYSSNSISDCKYLTGTCDVGIGNGASSTGITELDNIDKFPSVLEVVNGEGAFKEDIGNINGGYPILEWQ